MNPKALHPDPSEGTVDCDRLGPVLEEVIRRRSANECVPDEGVIAAHPDLMPELGKRLRALRRVEQAERLAESGQGDPEEVASRGPTPPAAASAQGADVSGLLSDSFVGYQILREIHRGGQGVVYQAIQKSTKRKVALKVMKEGPFAGPADRTRFEREVQILGQLQHPNIVGVHDSGTAAGSFYFVMDYIAGPPLDVYMASGERKINETLRLFANVCEAVNAAHLRGVIHRDLKPSNIRIDANGEPHILDFGLAKVAVPFGAPFTAGDEGGAPAMTLTGQFVGSLPWASPEQAEGAPSKIDVRTDVYSLGVILYQMLTGRFPYEVVGNMRDVLDRIMRAEPARPSTIRKQINDEVETIVLKCLQKERERRYQSAGELARDIQHYLAGEPIEAKRDSTLYLLRKQVRKYRVPLVVAAGFLVLLAASSVVAWTLYGRSQDQLYESLLAQARARRASGTAGRRFEALGALQKATAIKPSLDVRNEVIACLSLLDLRVRQSWKDYDLDFIEPQVCFDAGLERYLVSDWYSGRTVVRGVGQHENLFELGPIAGGKWAYLSPDGRYVARLAPSQCEIFNVDSAELISVLPLEGACCADFSGDSAQLAVGTTRGELWLFDMRERRGRPFVGAGTMPPLYAVHFDPAGTTLVATASSTAYVWDLPKGALVHKLQMAASIFDLAWSSDGTILAAACNWGVVQIWDTESWSLRYELRGHAWMPAKLGFFDDSPLFYTHGWDGTVRLWDVRDGAVVLTMVGGASGAARGAPCLAFYDGFHRHSHAVAEVVHPIGFQTLVGARSPTDVAGFDQVAVEPNGRIAMTAMSDHGALLWDLAAAKLLADLPIGLVRGAFFHPHRGEVFTISPDGVYRWPLVYTTDSLSLGPPILLAQPQGQRPFFLHGCLSTDGALLAVTVGDIGAVVLDTLSGTVKTEVGPHSGALKVALSPDKQYLVTSAWKGRDVKVWRVADGQLVHEFDIPRDACIAFSLDGRRLAISETRLTLWDIATWEPVTRLDRPEQSDPWAMAGPVAFAPGGRLAAFASGSVITLFDPQSGTVLARVAPPSPFRVANLAFTPDGVQLLCPEVQAKKLHHWDLRAIRSELAVRGLDWNAPPYPPAPPRSVQPLNVRIDLGPLGRASGS